MRYAVWPRVKLAFFRSKMSCAFCCFCLPHKCRLLFAVFQVFHLARPHMGPNLYFGEGFTFFHQDGHGTVDSGHLNLTGFSDVIMLHGGMTPEQKEHAMQLLCAASNTNFWRGLPHDTQSVSTLLLCWPFAFVFFLHVLPFSSIA